MADLVPQASFNSGEWSPNLFARVDIQKYRSGAALLENFFVDYRGGASTRPGSKYVLQAFRSDKPVRLITFQASFNVGYALEFGENYIRFYFQGSPVLETATNITGITRANPCVVTAPGHGLAIGDWIYLTGAGGMVQADNRYFSVSAVAGNDITLVSLVGVPINSTAYTAYTAGGTVARVYKIASPYAANDLALLKFSQVTTTMILCHPSYAPQALKLVTPTNWTIGPITFGSTAIAPTGLAASITLGSGTTSYSYEVTSIDANGQESGPSVPVNLLNVGDIATTAGSVQVTWAPAAGAQGYNIYKSNITFFGIIPAGVQYGFAGQVSATTFIDSNVAANFAQTPPIAQNPFVGLGIAYYTITANGAYTSVPTVTITGGAPAINATATVQLGAVTIPPTITSAGTGYIVGETINFGFGLFVRVTAIGGGGTISAWTLTAAGQITAGSTPANPLSQHSTSGSGTGATLTTVWGVTAVIGLTPGAGFGSTPTVVFSSGAATATANLAANTNGNPSVPSFFQQRLVLAAPNGAPQTFYMSQPGSFYNFDITSPTESDNAITETLVSGSLETIKSVVSTTGGMLMLTDKGSWMITGGGAGTVVTPSTIVASKQTGIGANDVPPILTNWDVLYVSSKGSAVRDASYNIYFNVFTSTDISVTASHLFFGYQIEEWAWAEQPYYMVWAVRSDGVMLTLTYLKEQEFIGWSHQTTQGTYNSVCAVTESTATAGNVDAVYTVVTRHINGNTVQYIERIAERTFPNGLGSAWCLDCALQYNGSPALTFYGAEQLAGTGVEALCTDNLGVVTVQIFTMPASGQFTLSAPTAPATGYTTVLVGLRFTCDLQTLAIDITQAPIQGRLKNIPYVDVRVNTALGLRVGVDFDHLVPMKDLVVGSVSSMQTGLESQLVTGLYSGDARTYLAPSTNTYGQFCIRQNNPFPATVLGVFPCLTVGDTDK